MTLGLRQNGEVDRVDPRLDIRTHDLLHYRETAPGFFERHGPSPLDTSSEPRTTCEYRCLRYFMKELAKEADGTKKP